MEEWKKIAFSIAGVSFLVIIFFLDLRATRTELNHEFTGVIQEISYSDKGTPEVLINGKGYSVNFPKENFKKLIERGDSLTKKRNSRSYKLVKYKTGEVLFSN